MAIDESFFIERQGRRMVLYAGLLAEAHERGLEGIDTEPIQTPTAQNGEVAICKATVFMEGGRKFSGIGDASPGNVGRGIVPHIIRMAETRAKARALRDAINVGVAALEEMGEEEERAAPRGVRQARVAAPREGGEEKPAMTPAQFGKLLGELEAGGYTRMAFEAKHGRIGDLTRADAARHIERLVKANGAKATAPRAVELAPGAPYPEEVE